MTTSLVADSPDERYKRTAATTTPTTATINVINFHVCARISRANLVDAQLDPIETLVDAVEPLLDREQIVLRGDVGPADRRQELHQRDRRVVTECSLLRRAASASCRRLRSSGAIFPSSWMCGKARVRGSAGNVA